jgi:hypothetical protein
MVVPVPEIAKLFRAPVRDVIFQRGKPGLRTLTINHRFVEYLKDERVGAVVADAFQAVVDGQSR